MNIAHELSYRLLQGRGLSRLGLTAWISFLGLVLGVACLVVSMAVVSGFERTLQRSVSDVTGHLQVLKTQTGQNQGRELEEKIRELEPGFVAATRVFWIESVAAHKGQIAGALLQGLDAESVGRVLSLESHLQGGTLDLGQSEDGLPLALIGKGLAQKFGLKVGDDFRVVVPLVSDLDPNSFRRKAGTFRVGGILNLGKYEFDERLVLASIGSVQKLADVGDRFSGLLIKLDDYQKAMQSSKKLSLALGPGFRVRDWRELNENIFEAVSIERVALFFVILVIVLAASFNVSSNCYISVLQRYPEIGILKAMGLRPRAIIQIFSVQGLFLGLLGCLGGFLLGGILGLLFSLAQGPLGLLPGSVYKLDHIDLVFRFQDLFMIAAATLLICALATWAPARRGSKLTAVEGLRYE